MRRFRALLSAFLGLLLLLDGVTAFKLWSNGLPKRISMTAEGESARVLVESVSLTGSDWIILLLLVGVHALLSYLVWTAWRSSSVRVGR